MIFNTTGFIFSFAETCTHVTYSEIIITSIKLTPTRQRNYKYQNFDEKCFSTDLFNFSHIPKPKYHEKKRLTLVEENP